MWLKPRLTSEPCACQPLLTPIVKELFYIEFSYPIWTPPPLKLGGSISFTASFGVSLGGRACIADRKVEMVLTPEATLSVRAQLRRMPTRVRCVCDLTCGDAARVPGGGERVLGPDYNPRWHRDGD